MAELTIHSQLHACDLVFVRIHLQGYVNTMKAMLPAYDM